MPAYGVPSSKQNSVPCGIARLSSGDAKRKRPWMFGCPSGNENCCEPNAYPNIVYVLAGENAGFAMCDFAVVVPKVTNVAVLFSCAVK